MKTYRLKTNIGTYIGIFATVWDAIDDALVRGATNVSARSV